MIKCLVTDLDGTLFDGHGASLFDLTKRNMEGLIKAKEHGLTIAGVKKLLCDGNFPASAEDFVGAMNNEGATTGARVASVRHNDVRQPDVQQLDLVINLLTAARDTLKNV